MPPSIDSLDLPPFKPRFPWWGADLQTLSVLLQSSPSDMSPHTSERLCFPMADRTGDILLGMLDRPEEPMANRPLVILIHGLTGCEDSVYILSAARHLLDQGYTVLRLNVRGAGSSRAYCGEHHHVGRTADFRRVLWQLPEDLTRDGVVAIGYSVGGAMLLKYLGEEGSFSPLARRGHDLRADRPDPQCAPHEAAAQLVLSQLPAERHEGRGAGRGRARLERGARGHPRRAQRVRLRRPVHLAALRLQAAPRTTTALCSPMNFMPEIRIPTLVRGGVRRSVDPDRALPDVQVERQRVAPAGAALDRRPCRLPRRCRQPAVGQRRDREVSGARLQLERRACTPSRHSSGTIASF